MDIEPVILIAAGTVIVGVVTVAACMRSNPTPKPQELKSIKPKKKSKGSKLKKVTVSKNDKRIEKPKSAPVKPENNEEEEEDVVVEEKDQLPLKKEHHSVSFDETVAATIASENDDKKIVADERTDEELTVDEVIKRSKKPKETPVQKAARLERQKLAKLAKKPESKPINNSTVASTVHGSNRSESSIANQSSHQSSTFDGWAVVEKKLKPKSTEEAIVESTPEIVQVNKPVEEMAAEVIDSVTQVMTIEPKKVGLIIGLKGATKIGIQSQTGVEINVPKAVDKESTAPIELSVTGPAGGVAKAIQAINELCTKGYCMLLSGPDFIESHVSIHPMYIPDIIGKGGSCIKAIQKHTDVKITMPNTSNSSSKTPIGSSVTESMGKVKIGLAGMKDKVAAAKGIIKEITKYYHSDVTHPGVIHCELEVPTSYYNFIIGAKGSEIKHIMANYQVNVYIPNAQTVAQNILIVGQPMNVSNAEKHIHKLIEKFTAPKEAPVVPTNEMENLDEVVAVPEVQSVENTLKGSSHYKWGSVMSVQDSDLTSSNVETSKPVSKPIKGRGNQDSNDPNFKDDAETLDEEQKEIILQYAPPTNGFTLDLGAHISSNAKFHPVSSSSVNVGVGDAMLESVQPSNQITLGSSIPMKSVWADRSNNSTLSQKLNGSAPSTTSSMIPPSNDSFMFSNN